MIFCINFCIRRVVKLKVKKIKKIIIRNGGSNNFFEKWGSNNFASRNRFFFFWGVPRGTVWYYHTASGTAFSLCGVQDLMPWAWGRAHAGVTCPWDRTRAAGCNAARTRLCVGSLFLSTEFRRRRAGCTALRECSVRSQQPPVRTYRRPHPALRVRSV